MADTPLATNTAINPIPPEIKGWNWGAFGLNWIWGIGNDTWIALLALIPIVNLVMIFVLGAKGNEWAWKNKHWDSVEDFKNTQRKWRNAWLILLLVVVAIILMVIASSGDSNNAPTAYQAAQTVNQQSQSPAYVPNPAPSAPANSVSQSTQDAANTLAMKAQCNKDGQQYFQNTVIANLSDSSVIQADEAAGIKSVTAVPSPTFAYNQAMKTCLIDYSEAITFYDYKGVPNAIGSFEAIDDIYANKNITSISIFPDGSIGGYVGETQAIFDANKQNLMVNGEECVGGNGNC